MFKRMCFQNISFAFENKFPLLDDVSFEFPLDQVVWVRGPNGSGKSALTKILAGVLEPQGGSYLINSQRVEEMSFEEFLPYRIKMGYSFDLGGLINNRSIYENLALPLQYHKLVDSHHIEKRVEYLLDLFEIKQFAFQRPASITGSNRKAAVVARAFVMNPEVLILDDPTTGLKASVRTMLKDLILEMRRRGDLRHVFITSDDAAFGEGLATTMIEVNNQQINFWNDNNFSGTRVA